MVATGKGGKRVMRKFNGNKKYNSLYALFKMFLAINIAGSAISGVLKESLKFSGFEESRASPVMISVFWTKQKIKSPRLQIFLSAIRTYHILIIIMLKTIGSLLLLVASASAQADGKYKQT